jgi:hypothetical protein
MPKLAEGLKRKAVKEVAIYTDGQPTWLVIVHKKDTIYLPLLEKQDLTGWASQADSSMWTQTQTKFLELPGHTSATVGNTLSI